MLVSLYTTRLILNALGASDYGIYNVVGGAIALLGFLHATMSSATQRFMSYYEGVGNREQLKHIFNVSTILHLLVALLLALLLLIVGYVFFYDILNIPDERMGAAKVIYGSLILSTVFTVVSVPYEAVLNAHENMLYYSIVGVVESVLKLTVALIVVQFIGDKLILYGLLMAVIPLISLIIMQMYCHRKYTECIIAPLKYWDKSMMKEISSFAGWNFLRTTSRMTSFQGMAIILNVFFGVLVNAAQSIANQISGQLMAFSNTMLKALNPVIVKNEGAQQRESMLKASTIGNKVSFLLFGFFSIPFIVEAPFILKIWLKEVPVYAVMFCRIVLYINSIRQLTVTFPISIGATGQIKQISIVESMLVFFLLPVSAVAFKMGAPAELIFYILLVIEVLTGCVRLYYMHKLCDLRYKYFFKNVFWPVIVIYLLTIFITFIIPQLLETSFKRLLISLSISSTLFLTASYFLAFSKEELAIIKTLIGSLLKKLNLVKFSKSKSLSEPQPVTHSNN